MIILAAVCSLVVAVTADKSPVPDAEVEIRASGRDAVVARGRTGPDGRAPPLAVSAGRYDVEVHARRFPFAALHDVVVRGNDRFPLPVSLAAERGTVVADGVVRDVRDRSVSGVLVAGWSQTIHFGVPTVPARVHTDHDGTFRIVALSHADVTVEARRGAEGDRREICQTSAEIRCWPNTVLHLRPGLPPPGPATPEVFEWTEPPSYLRRNGVRLHARIEGAGADAVVMVAILPASRRLEIPVHALANAYAGGTCLDCAESEGLRWQRFLVHGEELDLQGLPEDDLDVRAESPMGNAEVRVPRGRRRKEVTLRLGGEGALRGRAMHESVNPVLEGSACLSVPTNGDILRCVQIENGRFEFSRLAPGRVRLTVSALGMVSAVRDVDVPPSPPLDVGALVLPDERPSRP